MSIIKAQLSDICIVQSIVNDTISAIYPRYYPKGAVEFFLKHHNRNNIEKDIINNNVYLYVDNSNHIVGTVTIKTNEICRLFVLPDYHGKGYGKELLNFAEDYIFMNYDEIVLDSSFSAKHIYLKRGYKETDYNMILTENKDYLCFDVMKKTK